jgi:formylglycine-generating enzyme required for sulfatase activity
VAAWFEQALALQPVQYRTSKSREAFNAMGEQAIPFLAQQAEGQPSTFDKNYDKAHQRLPAWLKKLLPKPRVHWSYYGRRQVLARRILEELLVVKEIHRRIVAHSENSGLDSRGEMQPYTNTIPGASVSYRMVPIPAGEFLMGSPEGEPGRQRDEGPQVRVRLDAFWMGQFEVTWDQFHLFMFRGRNQAPPAGHPAKLLQRHIADAVSRPSTPYVELSMGMGTNARPAINMTQHAANKFCQWLSASTGHFYRLPTEAEWEYACRAGTTSAYSFGNEPAPLHQHAWFDENSDWRYQKVGTRKPNPWGLYDMHGNVAEWTLDQYDPDFYRRQAGLILENPWNRATLPYPHAVRGGSWEDPREKLRSASRFFSEPGWKDDPTLPPTVWYHQHARAVGFRIVRPLKVPSAAEMHDFWNSGVEYD